MSHWVEAFIGPFGSGKTEVAINRALSLTASAHPVTFVDLDLVDPYFRARQARGILEEAGVTVVAPPPEWDAADLPLLTPAVFAALAGDARVVIDVGGEAQGALVLRQLLHLLPLDAAVYLVVNPYRPFMRTPEDIAVVCESLVQAAGHPVTALVANPHLAGATSEEIVRRGLDIVAAASRQLHLPIAWTAVSAALLGEVEVPGEVMPLRLHMALPWEEDALRRPAER